MSWQLAIFGAIPALLAMAYYDRLDRKRPEPRKTLRRVGLAGGLSVIPVIVVELALQAVGPPSGTLVGALYEAFVVAAGPEELAKLACVWLFVWRKPEFDERMDGITYGARAGLGFALVENIGYLLGAESPAGYLWMFVGRAVLAVPGHAIWGSMMGYFAARRRFEGKGIGLWGGLLVAIVLHGTYDAALFTAPIIGEAGYQNIAAALFLVPISVIGGGALAVRRMVKKAIELDDADDHAAVDEAPTESSPDPRQPRV